MFSQSRFAVWKKIFSHIPWFSQKRRHSLGFLNATQFLGVINDNIFKLSVAFLLIDALGKQHAPSILSAAGAIYVIPFLLFSSSAGILADRFSKQKLLVFMKGAEILVMLFALYAFGQKIEWACYTLLFFLATHSAMFGPSKYGIIPELVPSDAISRANGLITSFTYLAIIVGTFFASFLTEFTDRNFFLVAVFCLMVAIIGFVCSFGIAKTPAQGAKKKINIFFVREIFHTLLFCRKEKFLLPAIFGSAYFLFIGAFTQLNIIPFALQSLHLSEVAGGYLFLSTALGIAFGSFIVGKLFKKKVELGLSCLSGFGIALLFFLLWMFSASLIHVTLFLVAIGILGGIFIVPFDSFIQLHSPNESRGQVIAAASFLSFAGVLLASFALYLFSQFFELSSASGFALVGIITLVVSVVLTTRLSEMTIPYFSRKILQPFFRFHPPATPELTKPSRMLLVMTEGTWPQALLLNGAISNLHLFLPPENKRCRPWFHSLFQSLHILPKDLHKEDLLEIAEKAEKEKTVPCLFLDKDLPNRLFENSNTFLDFFKGTSVHIYFVSFHKRTHSSPYTFSLTKHPPL